MIILRNEFHSIPDIFLNVRDSQADLTPALDKSLSQNVLKSWEDAILSEATETNLVRYFDYQLNLSVRFSDILFENTGEETNYDDSLLLLDYFRLYYPKYFDDSIKAPKAFYYRLASKLSSSVTFIIQRFQGSAVDPRLNTVMADWLQYMLITQPSKALSFRLLGYYSLMVEKLLTFDFDHAEAEKRLIDLLVQLNFNHLSFFIFIQNKIILSVEDSLDLPDKLIKFRNHKLDFISLPETSSTGYDPAWPSAKNMLNGWLNEEISLIQQTIDDRLKAISPSFQKIPIKIPVAQLGYLTRLFVEESNFGIQNLKVLFKFFADHVQTPRQTAISPGGISKAYYGADQQTAAKILGLLQKMTSRIKRDYFPAVVAVSATAHFLQGIY